MHGGRNIENKKENLLYVTRAEFKLANPALECSNIAYFDLEPSGSACKNTWS
jgi:hypothetical protein